MSLADGFSIFYFWVVIMNKQYQIERVMLRCMRLYNTGKTRQALVNATRLWNWIDHNSDYQETWYDMVAVLPWAFADEWPNNLYFTYND